MNRQYLSRELDIVYYKTMSKIAQYRRSVSKNNSSSIPAKVLQNQVLVKEVIQ